MTLRLLDSDIVHMDKGTYMWIQVTHFALETAQDDRSLLTSLIASPAYAHDYASPFDAAAVVTEPAVHGRWWRSRIHPELFLPWAASDAESLIQQWADDQDWTDPDFRQPPAVQRRLQDVYALLRSGDLYKLDNPGAEDEPQYGWVTGYLGFHEFVVIDRNRRSVQWSSRPTTSAAGSVRSSLDPRVAARHVIGRLLDLSHICESSGSGSAWAAARIGAGDPG